jgi:V/A-type H+-transporting ATPase subunit I
MIVPMKKVTLLAMESEKASTLAALRDLGVMQIESSNAVTSANTAELNDSFNSGKRLLTALEKHSACRTAKTGSALRGQTALAKVEEILEKRSAVQNDFDTVKSRLNALAVWGDFELSQLEDLKNKGIYLTLCSSSPQKLAELQAREDLQITVVDDEGIRCHYVVTTLTPPEPDSLPEFRLMEGDNPAELKRRAEALQAELDWCDNALDELCDAADSIRHYLNELDNECTLSAAADALGEHGAIVSLTGFVPEPAVPELQEAARKNGWGLLVTEPAEGDTVPTLIKRARWVQVIEPLFNFLGISPGYDELDVSSGVLIFFTIFYAMIVGDAGYGLIFLAATAAAAIKFRNNENAKVPLRLFGLLSIATIIWGIVTDNVFGTTMPAWMDWAKIPALSSSPAKDANTMCFCFILALVQLSMGRLWKAISEGCFKSYVSNIGWILVLIGNFILILKLLVYPGNFPTFMWGFFAVGLVMVIFSDVNWKDPAAVFQFPFNIINSFTDVLSYIRLFAVGMAGFYIADSFNGMAKDVFSISPYLALASAVILLFGHGLNLALCLMSVMVHGVRLNTLEFSNHVGLCWGGIKFQPFHNKIKTEEN